MNTVETPAAPSRVYRMVWWRRGSAAIFLAVALVVFIGILWGAIAGDRETKLWEMVGSGALAMGGVFWVLQTFSTTITVCGQTIELRTYSQRRALRFDQIRGRREYVVRGTESSTRYWKLEPNDDRLPTLDFQKYYNFDGPFLEWFNKLPYLDAIDKLRPKSSDFGLV